MNEASCGSCLTTASASLRMRAQMGSTLSIGVILCGWAIAVLRRRGFSLFEFSTDREPSVGAPPPDGTTLPPNGRAIADEQRGRRRSLVSKQRGSFFGLPIDYRG